MGTKRFGLDGGESLIPALEQIIKIGGQNNIKEVKIGMSHRGRLNVLANVLQKSYKRIFNEFAGEFSSDSEDSAGDVKYHLGASSDREFDGNSVHVSLTDNPSHLEAVNPVVLGQTRAKQFFIKIKRETKLYQYSFMEMQLLLVKELLLNVLRCLDYQVTILGEQFILL